MNGTEVCAELERLKRDGACIDRLLELAVERLHAGNRRFDWVGIYELYPDDVLRLGPFVGTPTEHVLIATGQGICGTAVAEKRNLNIGDVSKEQNYLACSAATRSELVVLIRRGDRIFGQIDIDSHQEGRFSEETVNDVERVAEWLADAYELRELARAGVAR